MFVVVYYYDFLFLYLFSIDFNVGHIVFEYSGNIHLWELIFTENDQQTSFSTSAITNDD